MGKRRHPTAALQICPCGLPPGSLPQPTGRSRPQRKAWLVEVAEIVDHHWGRALVPGQSPPACLGAIPRDCPYPRRDVDEVRPPSSTQFYLPLPLSLPESQQRAPGLGSAAQRQGCWVLHPSCLGAPLLLQLPQLSPSPAAGCDAGSAGGSAAHGVAGAVHKMNEQPHSTPNHRNGSGTADGRGRREGTLSYWVSTHLSLLLQLCLAKAGHARVLGTWEFRCHQRATHSSP